MKTTKARKRKRAAAVACTDLVRLLTRCSLKLRLPIVIHRGGKGRPGCGSAWTVKSYYPVEGRPYPGYVFVAKPTLQQAAAEFLAELGKPNDPAHRPGSKPQT